MYHSLPLFSVLSSSGTASGNSGHACYVSYPFFHVFCHLVHLEFIQGELLSLIFQLTNLSFSIVYFTVNPISRVGSIFKFCRSLRVFDVCKIFLNLSAGEVSPFIHFLQLHLVCSITSITLSFFLKCTVITGCVLIFICVSLLALCGHSMFLLQSFSFDSEEGTFLVSSKLVSLCWVFPTLLVFCQHDTNLILSRNPHYSFLHRYYCCLLKWHRSISMSYWGWIPKEVQMPLRISLLRHSRKSSYPSIPDPHWFRVPPLFAKAPELLGCRGTCAEWSSVSRAAATGNPGQRAWALEVLVVSMT